MIEQVEEQTVNSVSATLSKAQCWLELCSTSDLIVNSGVCALLPSQQQVAIFALSSGLDNTKSEVLNIYVVANWDPFGEANVMYRGIVGSINDEPMVSSPLYKQHFSLMTGVCFEQEEVKLTVYKARLNKNKVEIMLPQHCLS